MLGSSISLQKFATSSPSSRGMVKRDGAFSIMVATALLMMGEASCISSGVSCKKNNINMNLCLFSCKLAYFCILSWFHYILSESIYIIILINVERHNSASPEKQSDQCLL